MKNNMLMFKGRSIFDAIRSINDIMGFPKIEQLAGLI